jgi:hypothetical protein
MSLASMDGLEMPVTDTKKKAFAHGGFTESLRGFDPNVVRLPERQPWIFVNGQGDEPAVHSDIRMQEFQLPPVGYAVAPVFQERGDKFRLRVIVCGKGAGRRQDSH